MAAALKTAYLLAYNLVSAVGWAYVFYEGVMSLLQNKPAGDAWLRFSTALLAVQSLAGLEIVHSVIKLVPSPLASTIPQVFSRYAVLWGFTYSFPRAHNHWSLYLMALSWATTEVPRYLFYAVNLLGSDKVPYPLFWLRYSLFAILYPSGITGEILQIVQCMPVMLQRGSLGSWYGTLGLLALYLPGSPYMISHMFAQRKKQMQGLAQKARGPPPSAGIDFPLDEATGQRSTTIVNQGAFAASIKDADPEASQQAAAEKNWRFGYAKHVVRNVELSCHSNEQCIRIAETGLEFLHRNFVYSVPNSAKDGGAPQSMSVEEAMRTLGSEGFVDTYVIEGSANTQRADGGEYTVKYKKFRTQNENSLRGGALTAQLDEWVQKGVIEKDARDAIATMVTHREYHGAALRDKYFVLLGALSAMGPVRLLMELGCNVIAIDQDNRPDIWRKLIELAHATPGTGRMLFPIRVPKSEIKNDEDLACAAGANLLVQAPHIANWLIGLVPGKQLVIGGYAYLDSALFVRLAVAMDAIIARVCAARADTALAFLCSPTDVFVTDDDSHEARKEALKRIPWWQKVLRTVGPLLLGKNTLVPNAIRQVESQSGETFSIVDGLAVAQGPNYALAKRLQHWRCMVARERGHTVSTNIAPSTATESVVHNFQFAMAYIGMHLGFPPLEIVYQDLSNSVMTALMLHDVCSPHSAANPNTRLSNQSRLFSKTACHFGIWRCAFKCGTIGEISAVIGYLVHFRNYLIVAAAVSCVGVAWLMQKGAPHKWLMAGL